VKKVESAGSAIDLNYGMSFIEKKVGLTEMIVNVKNVELVKKENIEKKLREKIRLYVDRNTRFYQRFLEN